MKDFILLYFCDMELYEDTLEKFVYYPQVLPIIYFIVYIIKNINICLAIIIIIYIIIHTLINSIGLDISRDLIFKLNKYGVKK